MHLVLVWDGINEVTTTLFCFLSNRFAFANSAIYQCFFFFGQPINALGFVMALDERGRTTFVGEVKVRGQLKTLSGINKIDYGNSKFHAAISTNATMPTSSSCSWSNVSHRWNLYKPSHLNRIPQWLDYIDMHLEASPLLTDWGNRPEVTTNANIISDRSAIWTNQAQLLRVHTHILIQS